MKALIVTNVRKTACKNKLIGFIVDKVLIDMAQITFFEGFFFEQIEKKKEFTKLLNLGSLTSILERHFPGAFFNV